MSSFSTALSGLSADNIALDVVGNNLANLTTTGFKSNDVQFHDLLQQVSGGAQIGGGVGAPTTSRSFTQGSIQQTGGQFDAAIQGDGFFSVATSSGTTLYSRDGSFRLDSTGTLVNSNGEAVQGWMAANGVVNTGGATGNIVVSAQSLQTPTATANFTLSANLDAATATNGTFSTPIQVIDSLGNTHTLTANFTKTGANAWSYDIDIPGADVTGGTAGTPSSLATGTLTFNSAGVLTSPAAGSPVQIAASGLSDGAANLSMNWNLFDAANNPLVTQFAQASAASGTTQDGIQSAQMTGVALENGGNIVATFSNGKQMTIAQVAVAKIANPDSLISVGNNDYQLGADTIAPSMGAAGTGGRGTVLGGSLEASNADIAKEFTNLIVYQRGYQANSKVITTLDQVSQDLMNIIR
ncbi:MAG: flagellar hook protein FlgE [Acidobacteriia bacterium]|nr:flagellar hook protein FlgE [Terriglobia bacterium]